VHGFDLSHAMLAARAVTGQVRADLRRLPLADGRLDGLWCVAVLLHVPRDLVPGALAEFRRVLRPGGRGVISIAEGEGEGWERHAHPGGEVERYFVYHPAEAFAALLADAGLDILDAGRRSTHRDWLALHVCRPPGVH
jgi:SAM-dependent methyltransferase